MRNMSLSSSRLNDFMGCPRKYNYVYLQGFKSKHENTSKMDMGSLFHKLAETYYKAKVAGLLSDFSSAVTKIMDTGRSLGMTQYTSLSTEEIDLVVRTFRDYCTHYRYESYEIEEVEAPFAKILYEDEEQDLRVIITGTMDLLVKNSQGTRMVVDHKTKTRDIMPGSLSNQFMCYSWATERRIVTVNKILFNPSVSDEKRFKRQPYEYSTRAIEEWKTMAIYCALTVDKMNKAQYFPPNFNFCDTYGKCSFYSVCNQDPAGRVIELEENFIQSDAQYDDERFK